MRNNVIGHVMKGIKKGMIQSQSHSLGALNAPLDGAFEMQLINLDLNHSINQCDRLDIHSKVNCKSPISSTKVS